MMTQGGEICGQAPAVELPTHSPTYSKVLAPSAHIPLDLPLQERGQVADPNQVSIPGVRPVGARGVGLSELQQRLGDIQRRIGMAAGASTMIGVDGTTGSISAGTANNQFALALQRAVDGQAVGSDDIPSVNWNSGSNRTSGAGWSGGTGLAGLSGTGTGSRGIGVNGPDPSAHIPVYATKPQGLPPVTVSGAARTAGNGQLPDNLLESIGRDQFLAKPAADAYRRLSAMANDAGVTIGVRDSYRDYPSQVAVANRVGLYSQGGWAAAPGTSNHGWGLALDLELDQRAQSWMTDNAWRFGFFEDVPGEPWHWTYRAA